MTPLPAAVVRRSVETGRGDTQRPACYLGHCTRPNSPGTVLSAHLHRAHRTKGNVKMVKILVLGCVLAAVAITLKVRLDTPQGPQPLARAIVTTHLHKFSGASWRCPRCNEQSPLPAALIHARGRR